MVNCGQTSAPPNPFRTRPSRDVQVDLEFPAEKNSNTQGVSVDIGVTFAAQAQARVFLQVIERISIYNLPHKDNNYLANPASIQLDCPATPRASAPSSPFLYLGEEVFFW